MILETVPHSVDLRTHGAPFYETKWTEMPKLSRLAVGDEAIAI